ncbi:MAG: glycosyl hydrolase family 28-related protein [Bacteroidota bacterium]
MNRKLLSFVALLFVCNALAASNFTYNIKEFGAKGNGTSLNTEAIQEAIDACHSNGGGTVYILPGDYLSGTLILKSHVNLHLSSGATLLGSTDLYDYQTITPEFLTYAEINYTDYIVIQKTS